MTTTPHPFVDLEQRLTDPPADGVMVTHVAAGSPLERFGVVAGEIIVAAGEARPPDRMTFLQACRPTPEGRDAITLSVRGEDGSVRTLEAPLPLGGVNVCEVRRGVPAWDVAPDPDGLVDLSRFENDGAIWLRNSLEETRAGYEVLRWRRDGPLLHLDVHFALGGGDGQGGTWEYVTRASSVHRVERGLPILRTAFWESGKLRGDVALGDDRTWRGERGTPEGGAAPFECADITPMITAYTCTIVPVTMPLREGARITLSSANDGVPVPLCRFRFVCTGRETVRVDGEDVDAWCIVQRHYGLDAYGGDERMYVTDDRRLVRVDWGPNYAGCWGERVAPDDVLAGVPDNVQLPDDLLA